MIAHPETPTRSDYDGTVLVADFGDVEWRALFRGLARTEFTLSYVDDRTRLLSAVIALRPVAVLLPVSDDTGLTCAPLAARLCREAPDIRVITLWKPERDRSHLVEIVRAGSELCPVASTSDVVQCIARLRHASALSGSEMDVVRSLFGDVQPPWLVDTFLAAVRWAHRRLSVNDLAQLAGYSRRTLSRRSALAGWPPPEELIDWSRLMRASLIQWRDQSTLVALAHASGFTGPHALHGAVERLLGAKAAVASSLTPLSVGAGLRRRLEQ